VKNHMPKMDWKSLQAQASEVLGEEFWEDIADIIPIRGPRVDVYETDEKVVVVAELPGLASPNEVTVVLKGSVLSIQGKIKRNYPVDEDKIIQSERFHGKFKREISLPSNLAYKEIKAAYKKGLLEIHLTKNPAYKSEPIIIEVSKEESE
jgi:HSP20 family protein